MSLSIASLNSGSNGNCYYIGNDEEAIFVDVGISCREITRRMDRLGLPVSRIKAIFVSHEHTDHISGVEQVSKKFDVPVYITEKTLQGSCLRIGPGRSVTFLPYEPVRVGALEIKAFPKYHDACDPHSFVITSNDTRVGVFTDIGRICKPLTDHFRSCDAAFLESNYDTSMLMQGRYPVFLKNRIRGGQGHLSNDEALDIFTSYRSSSMSHLVLSHLSRENNHPDIVHRIFNPHAGRTHVCVASRFSETSVFHVNGRGGRVLTINTANSRPSCEQLSLF